MAINHDYVQGPVDGIGKKIDNVIVDSDKERQVAAIGGGDSGDKDSIASVVAAAPAGTEFGLVTRNIPSGTQPVSGTFFQATQPVSAASLPLPTGAAAAAQLPAALDGSGFLKVHEQGTAAVSVAALPLPTGAATEATLALVKAKTDNLDVTLSSRLKPADTLAGVTTVGAVTSITNPVAVTGPLTDAQLRATPVPVSGTVAATVAGAATETGNLLVTANFLSVMLETQKQQIKLLTAILVTLGNNGAGYVNPEEATEIVSFVN